jgi:DNA-binding transcriptional LysR family regulator
MLEFKLLEAYIRVYELRSFSRAAEEMFLSQPSISAYISMLEKDLQTQLIFRSTKEFVPTKSGDLLYEHAKDILALRDRTIASIKSLSDATVGSIDILASSVPAQYILPEILGAYRKRCPDVVFNMEQADTADVVKGIAMHKGEIGFVGAMIDNPKCVFENFVSEKLILIAPNETRFQKIKSTDIPQLLREEYFVIREIGSGTRLEYEGYLRQIGVDPSELKVSVCLNNTQSIIHAVASGLGVSFVSELAARPFIKQKAVIPIDADGIPSRNIYIVLKKDCQAMPAADAFLKYVRTYAKKS